MGLPSGIIQGMKHTEFMHYLRHRTPNTSGYEPLPRIYRNAKGIEEIIYLPRCWWSYVDWAEANTDIDFAVWVVHCDQNPFDDWTLSHLLMYWLWLDECNRFREGLPTPDPYPPMGYQGWADEYHSRSE